ncbi:transposase [Kamptonema formosum]|uniref:transposase n=1 Tax=Kamptonema formosum TaxID=331992 RepID=UPI001E2B28CE
MARPRASRFALTLISRKPRHLQTGYSYHITTRCNNREFKLSRRDCREVFLYAIKKALDKYQFKLYALCIMSNHVHYLIEPAQSEDLPKIMHFLNWYTAMCFNRMLGRTGHFWEKRYYCDGFAPSEAGTRFKHAPLHSRQPQSCQNAQRLFL